MIGPAFVGNAVAETKRRAGRPSSQMERQAGKRTFGAHWGGLGHPAQRVRIRGSCPHVI